MKALSWAAVWLSALFACAVPAAAQQATISRAPAGYAPEYAPVTVPATATPYTTAITAAGSYGPFVPQLGRSIWVTLTGTWSGAVQVGTTTTGNCADAVPLTVAGQTWANFTANANEPIGEETRAGAGWCLIVATGFTGTLNPRLGQ